MKTVKSEYKSRCKCGRRFKYIISPYIQTEQRVCPRCGRIHYICEPIDFEKVNKEGKK